MAKRKKDIVLSKKQIEELRMIAEFYGCKLKIRTNRFSSGYWWGDTIWISEKYENYEEVFSVFFHELSHFINWKTGNYSLYHRLDGLKKLMKVSGGYENAIYYALKAEVATEAAAKKLMRLWTPDLKFIKSYSMKKRSFAYLTTYFANCVKLNKKKRESVFKSVRRLEVK